MTISRSVAAAMLVQIALAAPANAGLATTGLPAGRIYIKPGESPIKALHDAQFDARTASRIAAWRAAGHRALPGSAPPAITAGAVTASTLTAGQPGQYPSMSFTYQASAGLASVNFVFTSPNGQAYNFADYFEVAYATSGTISYASISQLSPWSQPGKWTLSAIKITDLAGTSTIYQAAQVAALFPAKTYTVVNTGLSDGIPPKVIRGSLPSPTVSLSSKFPLLKASITASDSGSGLWLAYVQFQPPGSTLQYYEDVPVPLPVAKGAINADTIFASYDSPGTYAIVGYGVCDFAQNCTIDNNDADIVKLFGTDSFTLTP